MAQEVAHPRLKGLQDLFGPAAKGGCRMPPLIFYDQLEFGADLRIFRRKIEKDGQRKSLYRDRRFRRSGIHKASIHYPAMKLPGDLDILQKPDRIADDGDVNAGLIKIV